MYDARRSWFPAGFTGAFPTNEHTVPGKLAQSRFTSAMTLIAQGTVTRLLAELRAGNQGALDELLPLLYGELQALAHLQRRRWRGDYTLDTTALVHEAYLKLLGQKRLDADSRAHFLALTARAMRHILCNYARDRRRQKRGGGADRLALDDLDVLPGTVSFSAEQAERLGALDDALRRLEDVDKRQSEIVECRFFGAMSIEDTAAALGTSPATVKRLWALARAWLYREMQALEGT
jgi:RNA polymerase sigma factor (TIGR02999 family)